MSWGTEQSKGISCDKEKKNSEKRWKKKAAVTSGQKPKWRPSGRR